MRELFSYVVGVIPNSRIVAISEAEDLFEEINFSGHHNLINSIIGGGIEFSGLEFGESLEYCYYQALLENLGIFGIRMTDDVHSVKDVLTILRGIVSLGEPLNHDVIESIMQDEVDPLETLANLLAELEEPDMFWFMQKIDYVDPDLMVRIKAELNDVEFIQELGEVQIEVVAKYREYMTDKEEGVVAESLHAVEFLPMNYRNMVVALQNDLRSLSSHELVEQLYQLNILSNSDDVEFAENAMLAVRGLFANDLTKQAEVESMVESRVNEA